MDAATDRQESRFPVPFGKYVLLRRIGRGGMADVFLARPRAQRRLVAIKCIRESFFGDQQYIDMFVREGKLAVRLDHPHIVKTHEIGSIQSRHFICMEYISGVDLNQVLRRHRAANRRLPVPHSLHIAAGIFEGLHYAHELSDASGQSLNLVNRDVSPSNVRLSFEGEVKLLDFGIAKAASGLSSEIGMLKGKISHMSPEQVRGLPLDRRSDIFSAGIVLYETLTLERLFRADSGFQLMDLVRRAEVRPPSTVNTKVPGDIDAIVLKALQKTPQDRFQTAGEVAARLRELLVKYRFSRVELAEHLRDVCREEWERDQEILDSCLRGDVPALKRPRAEENYGELELSFDQAIETPEPPPRKAPPRWLYGLLAFTVLLLVAAVILAVVVLR